MDTNKILYIVIGVAAIAVVGYLVYRFFFSHTSNFTNLTKKGNNAKACKGCGGKSPQRKGKGVLVLYSSLGCPGCEKIKPEWDKAADYVRNVMGESTKEFLPGPEMAKQGIRKVPTIRWYPEGFTPDTTNFVEYVGDRTSESIIDFVESN